MSHVDNMVLVVLGVTSSLKCLVLYLHVVEERSVALLAWDAKVGLKSHNYLT